MATDFTIDEIKARDQARTSRALQHIDDAETLGPMRFTGLSLAGMAAVMEAYQHKQTQLRNHSRKEHGHDIRRAKDPA